MKKLVFTAVMLVMSAFAYGQEDIMHITNVDWYGVDYSLARVFGASEPAAQFKETYNSINELILSEPDKFDLEKYFFKSVDARDLSIVESRHRAITESDIKTTDAGYTVSDEQIAELVKQYGTKETDGTGFIIVGQLLNKTKNFATYKVVFFDLATKNIVYIGEGRGNAGGFGLRNFWANSIYDMIKRKWKY